jgi:hypothetical protein
MQKKIFTSDHSSFDQLNRFDIVKLREFQEDIIEDYNRAVKFDNEN